jgi:hypothetical protein
MEEIWKNIEGYDNYQISNIGNVRKITKNGFTHIKCSPRGSQKTSNTKEKYMGVTLSKNGTRKGFSVHRLVAEAFIPNPNNYPSINHINGIKDDNCVCNLEWCTIKQNIQHAYDVLNMRNHYGSIKQYSKDGKFIKEYDSVREASRELGIHFGNIVKCANKQRNVAGGYVWRFHSDDTSSNVYKNKRDKRVVMLDKNGNRIMTFDSITEAALYLNKNQHTIASCCQGITNTAGGYMWRFLEQYDENEFDLFKQKHIIQKTIHNVIVKEYNSIDELVESTNYGIMKIKKMIEGEQCTAYGFLWELV